MQGILNSGMQAEAGARPANPQPERPAQGRPEPQGRGPQRGGPDRPQQKQSNTVDMDPEVAGEQRNALVNGMLGQLYGPQLDRAATILEQSAPEPVEGIGRVVSGVMSATYKRLQDDDKSVPPGVMFQAGMMVSQAVGEMAMRMGILDESTEAEAVESGFMMALGNFGRANKKGMSDDERERYMQLIDGLEEGKRMAMEGGQSPQDQPPQKPADSGAPAPRETMMRGGA